MTNMENNELSALSHELVQLRYSMDYGKMSHLFYEMSFIDYAILSRLCSKFGLTLNDRVYLKELAEVTDININSVSKMVSHLSDKGYVYWKREDNSTYILLSEHGQESLDTQQKELRKCSKKISDEFGMEKTIQLLNLLKDLENILHEDIDLIDYENV